MKKFSVMEWMDNILARDLCHRGDAGLESINAIIAVVRTIKIFIVLPVRVFFHWYLKSMRWQEIWNIGTFLFFFVFFDGLLKIITIVWYNLYVTVMWVQGRFLISHNFGRTMVMMSQFVESFYGRFFWVGEKSMTINLRNLSMVYLL